ALGRDLDAAQHIAPTDHDADGDAHGARRHDVGRIAVKRGLMDAEPFGTAERLTRQLDDDAAVYRHGHAAILSAVRCARQPLRRPAVSRQRPPAAAPPDPKSPSGRSMPPPSAYRTKPATLTAPPTLPSASLSAWA